jgi:hypothetical protein
MVAAARRLQQVHRGRKLRSDCLASVTALDGVGVQGHELQWRCQHRAVTAASQTLHMQGMLHAAKCYLTEPSSDFTCKSRRDAYQAGPQSGTVQPLLRACIV